LISWFGLLVASCYIVWYIGAERQELEDDRVGVALDSPENGGGQGHCVAQKYN